MNSAMWFALAGTLLLPSTGFSQPRGFREGAGHPVLGTVLMAVSLLDLSDAQQAEIDRVVDNARARLEELSAPPDADDETGFMEYFCSREFTARGMESMMNERLDRMRLANGVVAEALAGVHRTLTPAQLDELQSIHGEHRERMRNRLMNRPAHRGSH